MTLTPAYGRDYKSKAAIHADLSAGKDFTIADISSPYDGSYVNLHQLLESGNRTVTVRYRALQSVCVVELDKLRGPSSETL